MKSLFNKKKKLIKQLNEIGYLLDKEIEKRWEFHYSQTDCDPIIDTLDYGTNNISYKDFVDTMNDFKEKEALGEWIPNV